MTEARRRVAIREKGLSLDVILSVLSLIFLLELEERDWLKDRRGDSEGE